MTTKLYSLQPRHTTRTIRKSWSRTIQIRLFSWSPISSSHPEYPNHHSWAKYKLVGLHLSVIVMVRIAESSMMAETTRTQSLLQENYVLLVDNIIQPKIEIIKLLYTIGHQINPQLLHAKLGKMSSLYISNWKPWEKKTQYYIGS